MVIKIITGYGILGHLGYENIEPLRKFHRNPFVEVPLFLLFIYHAMYGLRTALIDLGFRREKLLFWVSNILGFVFFIVVVYIFLIPH
jgi:succinate dehydrogenase/fumarate reductase cytochrome b subunit